MLKKLILTIILTSFINLQSVYGAEFQLGSGTMGIKGGFAGLTDEITSDVSTYTLLQQHQGVLNNSLFYAYEITWYDSDLMLQGQNQLPTLSSDLVNLSATNYKFQGLDANFAFGKPLFISDDGNQYISIGLNLGLSIPWIENNGGEIQSISIPVSPINSFAKSKTEIQTFKLGPVIRAAIKLNDTLSLNADFSYNYQTGTIKNDKALNTKLNVDGSATYLSVGLKIAPIKTKTKIGFMNLNPSLYFTAGYDYAHWVVKDSSIDITGAELLFNPSDLEINSNIFRLGMGYSF